MHRSRGGDAGEKRHARNLFKSTGPPLGSPPPSSATTPSYASGSGCTPTPSEPRPDPQCSSQQTCGTSANIAPCCISWRLDRTGHRTKSSFARSPGLREAKLDQEKRVLDLPALSGDHQIYMRAKCSGAGRVCARTAFSRNNWKVK